MDVYIYMKVYMVYSCPSVIICVYMGMYLGLFLGHLDDPGLSNQFLGRMEV